MMIRNAVIVILAIIGIAAAIQWVNSPEQPMRTPDTAISTPAGAQGGVKIVVDLNGKWTTTDDKKPTMVARLDTDSIEIDMVQDGSLISYWRGTALKIKDGQQGVTSTAFNSEFALSTAPTKDFVYQDGKLYFEITAVGVTTTRELSRA